MNQANPLPQARFIGRYLLAGRFIAQRMWQYAHSRLMAQSLFLFDSDHIAVILHLPESRSVCVT